MSKKIIDKTRLSNIELYRLYKSDQKLYEYLFFEFMKSDDNADEVEAELKAKNWELVFDKADRKRYRKAFEIDKADRNRYINEYELKQKVLGQYEEDRQSA